MFLIDRGLGGLEMKGTPQGDYAWGGDGNDTIHGGDGRDLLYGWTDDDLLYGDGGDDTLDGGLGDDTLIGGDGNDKLVSGGGGGLMNGGAGADTFIIGPIGEGKTVVVEGLAPWEGDTLQLTNGGALIDFSWGPHGMTLTFADHSLIA